MPWVKTRVTDDGVKRFVGCYRDPDGRQRSAGTYSSNRAAERAAHREEAKVRDGAWHDASRGEVTFKEYSETVWLPSRQIEASTRAAYRSYMDRHFVPFFGARQMGKVMASDIQRWVSKASAEGLSPASIKKYHSMLQSLFDRAVRDRVITFNPCVDTDLPKVIRKRTQTLTPEEYELLIGAIPVQHQLMIETAIGTGMRWGELAALRPRHLDLERGMLTISETIVELSKKNSPTGERMIYKPYPKDDEPRTIALPPDLAEHLANAIHERGLGANELLFATRDGTPISRNTFRTRIWQPAVKAAGIGFNVRIHDLRHAHASWLLAGGSDLKSVMDRLGHAQITTTQQYLHALPQADQTNLDAFHRIRNRPKNPDDQ